MMCSLKIPNRGVFTSLPAEGFVKTPRQGMEEKPLQAPLTEVRDDCKGAEWKSQARTPASWTTS